MSKHSRSANIPGPIGLLVESLRSTAVQEPSPQDHNSPIIILDNEFDKNPWLAAFNEVHLSPDKENMFDVCKIPRDSSILKIPQLLLRVKSIHRMDREVLLTLHDPSGEIEGYLHQEIVSEWGKLILPGVVLLLHQISLFSPLNLKRQYLNIVQKNLLKIFSLDNTCFLVKHSIQKEILPKQICSSSLEHLRKSRFAWEKHIQPSKLTETAKELNYLNQQKKLEKIPSNKIYVNKRINIQEQEQNNNIYKRREEDKNQKNSIMNIYQQKEKNNKNNNSLLQGNKFDWEKFNKQRKNLKDFDERTIESVVTKEIESEKERNEVTKRYCEKEVDEEAKLKRRKEEIELIENDDIEWNDPYVQSEVEKLFEDDTFDQQDRKQEKILVSDQREKIVTENEENTNEQQEKRREKEQETKRIAREQEVIRIEQEQEAIRIEKEQEAIRIEKEQEAIRIEKKQQVKRIEKEQQEERIDTKPRIPSIIQFNALNTCSEADFDLLLSDIEED